MSGRLPRANKKALKAKPPPARAKAAPGRKRAPKELAGMTRQAVVVATLAVLLAACGDPSSSDIEGKLQSEGLASVGKPQNVSCHQRGPYWDCDLRYRDRKVKCSTDWRSMGWTPYAPITRSDEDSLEFACNGPNEVGIMVIK